MRKNVLITGGSSGIGFAVADLFVCSGAVVGITGRNVISLDAAVQKLQQSRIDESQNIYSYVSDAGNLFDIDKLVSDCVADLQGGLDVLVLNAGLAKPMPIDAVTESHFDLMMDVNFKGVYFLIQKALPLLKRGSAVVVLTSISNRIGTPGFSVYAASKAALASIVRSLGVELIGRGIRVNAVSPGPIETPMHEKFGLAAEQMLERKALIEKKSPIGRFGGVNEVAGVVMFLASSDASYIVGQEIVVDGGIGFN